MLTCIACSKQLNAAGSLLEQEDDVTPATPATKQTVKALISQIKDIAIKDSRAYKNCKPCQDHLTIENMLTLKAVQLWKDTISRVEELPASIPPLEECGRETELRLKPISSGDRTPASVSDRTESVVFMEEEDEPKEWVAQVEPGVLITFVIFPKGAKTSNAYGSGRNAWCHYSKKLQSLGEYC